MLALTTSKGRGWIRIYADFVQPSMKRLAHQRPVICQFQIRQVVIAIKDPVRATCDSRKVQKQGRVRPLGAANLVPSALRYNISHRSSADQRHKRALPVCWNCGGFGTVASPSPFLGLEPVQQSGPHLDSKQRRNLRRRPVKAFAKGVAFRSATVFSSPSPLATAPPNR